MMQQPHQPMNAPVPAATRPTDEIVMMLGMIAGFASVGLAGWYGIATLTGKKDKLPAAKIGQVAFGLATFSFV